MSTKDDVLDLVRRILTQVQDIERKADDIQADPIGTADDIKSLANDSLGKLRRLRTAVEEM